MGDTGNARGIGKLRVKELEGAAAALKVLVPASKPEHLKIMQ